MGNQKVLLIVEGEKSERVLFTKLYNLYGMSNVEIVAYKTNIYALYNRLKKEYSDGESSIDFEAIDLPLFLNDYLKLEEAELLNEADFSDIILIFDFDPQDPGYDKNILLDLIDNYSESTGRGKLYLNYPMLESYKDVVSLDDSAFQTSLVTLATLKQRRGKTNLYKIEVDARTRIKQVADIDTQISDQLMKLHQKKLQFVLEEDNEIDSDYRMLCEIQCDKLSTEEQIWILNTSILHLFDEYGYINDKV